MRGALDLAIAALSALVRRFARGGTRAAERLADAADWLDDRRRGNPRRPQGP